VASISTSPQDCAELLKMLGLMPSGIRRESALSRLSLRRRVVDGVEGTLLAKDYDERGRCPVCLRRYPLRIDGTLRRHVRNHKQPWAQQEPCPGGGGPQAVYVTEDEIAGLKAHIRHLEDRLAKYTEAS
jgi:hypothetical protein